jgi:hypothetical protein
MTDEIIAATETAPQDSIETGLPATVDNATQPGEKGTTLTATPLDGAEAGEGDASTDNVYTDFVMPEGMELNSTLLDQAVPIFKELGLTKEQSQKLVDFHAQQIQNGIKSQAESFDQLKQDWRAQTENDPELGGDKLTENVATARVALDKLGTPELTKLLDDFGMGNHPEMIRFMARVGKFMKEDSPGNTGNAVLQNKKDRTSILYPNS